MKAKKLLITGGQGMLATDLARAGARAGYQVTGLSHAELDVTQAHSVRETFDQIKPDIVITTPGIGVDACESDPGEGFRIHTWAAQVVAQECRRAGAWCVYISTCGLFGDEVKFYSEYDQPVLKTQYAKSKLLGEQAVFQQCDKSIVIRPGWLFGGDTDHARNFVYQRFLEAGREPVLRSASDKFGAPTFTVDLSEKILEIVGSGLNGLYHVTNSGKASRYDYVKFIVEAFGLDTPVEPVDSSAYPRAASVPDCELLDNLNLRFAGVEPMRPWQEAIEAYVATLNQQG